MTQLVNYLIEQKGISSDFVDAWGKPAKIKLENQQKLLGAMGYSVDNEEALAAQLEAEAVEYWTQALPSVLVVRKGENCIVNFRVSISEAAKIHTFKLVLEDNTESQYKITPVECKLLASQVIDETEWHE
jgi:4-alpha-glucanotransferase